MLDRTTRQASPLDEKIHAAADKLKTLRFTRLSMEPEREDLDGVMDDLEILVQIFDEVILEVGKYAGDYFGLTQTQVRDYFADQLRGAIDGNATFVLEEAMSDIEESRSLHETSLWER